MGLAGTESPHAYVQELFRYHDWRREQIELVIEGLEMSNRDEQSGVGFGNINELLNHLVWAEQVWYNRIKGLAMPDKPSGFDNAIFQKWNAISGEWEELIETSGAEILTQTHEFPNSTGKVYRMSTMEIIVHVIDHATYHIGQLMSAVRRLGGNPAPTNYIHYLRTKE